jgi:ABC-type iron transport system FetAB ATPase subunit
MGELLKIDHIGYTYHTPIGETTVLSEVSFHIKEGEFVAVVGPDGCGNAMVLSWKNQNNLKLIILIFVIKTYSCILPIPDDPVYNLLQILSFVRN